LPSPASGEGIWNRIIWMPTLALPSKWGGNMESYHLDAHPCPTLALPSEWGGDGGVDWIS